MPPKDYRTMGEDLVNIAVRIPQSVMGEIDAHVERLRAASRWAKVGRSDALRDLILRALDGLTAPASPAPPPAVLHAIERQTAAERHGRPGVRPTTREPVTPASTATRHLGKLCPRGHDATGNGQSLRNADNQCLACQAEAKRAKRATKRQAAPAD